MSSQSNTVTILQALASSSSGLFVADTALHIAAALPNPSLVARVTSFSVSSPAIITVPQLLALASLGTALHAAAGALTINSAATVTAAQLIAMEGTPGFTLGVAASLTLSDTTAHVAALLASHATWFSQLAAVSVMLDGTSIGAYPAVQLNNFANHKPLTFVASPGHTTLNVAAAAHDLGSNAASLNALQTHTAVSFTLTNDGTAVTATDASGLAILAGFSPAASTVFVSDTAANIAAHAASLFGAGFATIQVSSGTFAGTVAQLTDPTLRFLGTAHAQLSVAGMVSAATANLLSALSGFTAGGHVLAVSDVASALLALSPAALAVVTATTLSADATVTAAAATTLAADPSFSAGGHHLVIADSAANLAGLAPAVAAFATAETLNVSANLSAAAAVLLTAAPGFNLASGVTLTVTDVLPALLALPLHPQLFAAAIVLAANASATAAQVNAFAALPHAGLGGFTIAVSDLAANLLTLSGPALADTASTALLADASVTVGQLTSLAALPGFSANGHALTVSDTAANLLAITPGGLLIATAITLSADATLMAAQAVTLLNETGFSVGAHHLTIADTAQNLLALPHADQVAATTLALSGSQSVTQAQLTQLAALGIKFDPAGYHLTCLDNAANLAALSPGALALASTETLNLPATIGAVTAAALALLPNLTAAANATLTIQDNVTNLISLGGNVPAITTTVQLAGGSVVAVSAAQAHALSIIPHFTPAGASITVSDTVANLLAVATSSWQLIAGATQVVDTAANLAANALGPLVQMASSVTLSGNAQVSATLAGQIATIPHFAAGAFVLHVTDTAAGIAAHAAAIISVAGAAIVSDSGPISAAVADQLATVSAAGKLSFQGGNQLEVQDSFANLTAPINSTGYALAARIGVADSAANLVAASTYNWGALNPSYTLTAAGNISASQASTLAGLGAHYASGGYTLQVLDGAAAVAGAASALAALGITANVTDTAANIAGNASALQTMGSEIAVIHTTDIAGVSAATAAALSGFAGKLAGPALHVTDTAADVNAVLANLVTLGTHVAVAVIDSAADVAGIATQLATLGNTLSVTLTDTVPITVSATIAAGLAPVASLLVANTTLAVTDTGVAIAAHETGLLALGGDLGALTLSDGTTQSAATAAALAPLDTHLGLAVELTATGTGAAITANEAGLLQLATDGHLLSVTVANTSVLDATGNAAALNALAATITVLDTAAAVDAALASLSTLSGLSVITLSDAGTPALSMTIATLAADAPVLAKINTAYTVTIQDTAASIASDLASGAASILAAHASLLGAVSASDGLTVTLTAAQILAPGIDAGATAALAHFTGPLSVTGVALANLGQVLALPTPPATLTVSDTSADIASDLAQGSAALLVTHASQITGIVSSDGAAIMLTASQALITGIDNTASSAIGLLSGASLAVSFAAVSQLAGLRSLYVQPATITVSDTAAHISADLDHLFPSLSASLATIISITVSDGLPLTITETDALTPGIDDGPGSVLSKMILPVLDVTGVDVAHLGQVLGLPVGAASVTIADTAAHIVSMISTVAGDISQISSITVSGAPLTLSANEALLAHIDDGPGSVIGKVAGHVFNVSGAMVAQLTPLVQLAIPPASIAVSDSSAQIAADLVSGASSLAADLSSVSTITVTHGVLTLTDTQAQTILGSAPLDAVFAKLLPTTIVSVTAATVADVASLAASTWPHISIGVVDTAANISADLSSGHSSLLANTADLTSVVLNGGGVFNVAALAAMAALPGFDTGNSFLYASDTAAAIAGISPAALAIATAVHVSDTDVHVLAALDALQVRYDGQLTITVTNQTTPIVITAAGYLQDAATIDTITNTGIIAVTGSVADLAPIAATLAADTHVAAVNVTDNAFDLLASLSSLQSAGAKLKITLTDTTLLASYLAPLLALGSAVHLTMSVVDTGAQIAALLESGNSAAIAYLRSYGALLSGDSAVTATDAAAIESLGRFSKNGHLLSVWDTASHLTTPAYSAALANAEIDSVHLKTTGGAVSVTAATAAALFGIPNFSTANPDATPNHLNVSDTAAQIEASLAALTSNRPGIFSITVNASATISDQTLSDLQGLAAVAGVAAAITVRDTASVIATNATAQGSWHSIEPAAWTLSANGTVTETQAAFLGVLANFTAGAYIISLNLASNTVISIADANALGNLGAALSLIGAHPIVDGTVAQLTGLSPAALLLITPAITDSAADISMLSLNSPLLTGTVDVTGSENYSAQSAAALLALVHTGAGGPGIAAGSLTFDNPHFVMDNVASMRTLLTSAGWTGNGISVHNQFQLVAFDTISNLINPANTSTLASLAASSLSSGAAISASNATSLANLATTIHFGDAYLLTVDDSPAALLNPANSAGLGLAQFVGLSGPATVDAADAESLLGIAHFQLTTALTISDSSANLLDGVLGNAITTSGFGDQITVQLAGPETLDADTAETLVSLAGFADTANLTIADGSSYLLNTANLSAEHMAASVTLAGDETVSANTVLRLSTIPHFTPGSSHLVLANNDFANAATLHAIADDGTAFQSNGHVITLTQDVLDLTSAEFTALQSDVINANGHAIGVTPTVNSITDAANLLTVSVTGIAGATAHVYAQDGTLILAAPDPNAVLNVNVADAAPGQNFAITETVGGTEGAPLVILDAAMVELAAGTSVVTFASSGQIQVDTGKFINVYLAGSVPALSHPALVYDPVAHTVSLDLPGGGAVPLITLGGTTHPASLAFLDITFKHHG